MVAMGLGPAIVALLIPCATGPGAGVLRPEDLKAAAAYSSSQRGTSLLVLQGGKAIWEEYSNGARADEARKIYSGTKLFWNLLALAAEEDGLISLNGRAADTMVQWRGDVAKSRIRVRQLLDFDSGLDPAFVLHGDTIVDRDAFAVGRPLVAAPGREFIYGPCSIQVVHAVLKAKLAARGESPTGYLERRVLAPLGLGPQRYLADGAGNPLLASGFMLSAREWARVGELLLREGSPILRREKFWSAFRGTRANGAFGLGLWNNAASRRWGARDEDAVDVEEMLERDWPRQRWGGAFLCRSAPRDLFASIGSMGQRLYVVPSLGLVIVRMGGDARYSDPEFLGRLFPRR